MLSVEYFAFLGPNWRSDKKVVEIRMSFGDEKVEGFPPHVTDVKRILVHNEILSTSESFPQQPLSENRWYWCASLLAQTALVFQRKAGHQVNFFDVIEGTNSRLLISLVEYEHADVGLTAVKLAWEFLSGKRKQLTEPFRQFKMFARDRNLPADTAVLMRAAKQRGLSVFQLERKPFDRDEFDALTNGECIRQNSLIMLGNGEHQKVLDSFFCISVFGQYRDLINSRDNRLKFLQKLSIPLYDDLNSGPSSVDAYDMVVINNEVIDIIDQENGMLASTDSAFRDAVRMAIGLHEALEYAPLVASVKVERCEKPTQCSNVTMIDFTLSPRLDDVYERCGQALSRLESASEHLLDGFFSGETPTEMPIFAVTGTNGKTTTTRMIEHILRADGMKTGMVCTDGLYTNGQLKEEGDSASMIGHVKVLTDSALDVAILETHHRGILRHGFAYMSCDFAICLNVTDDHLGVDNIETVDQMAMVKRAVPERAREVAILNADDQHCLAMIDSMIAKTTCLVSSENSIGVLKAGLDHSALTFCTTEMRADVEWIVVHRHNEISPIMPVCEIPATFDGAARFNVSNSMHAIAATFLSGVNSESIREAMSTFVTGESTTPGRMNIFDELPFRIIMDFAHNPDGVRKVCEFVDTQAVSGRKVLVFSGDTSRLDETIRKVGRMAAGHFDFYFCKDYVSSGYKPERTVTQFLVEGLREKGVSRSNIAVKTSGKSVIFEIFESCGPGDLLVMLMGSVEKAQLPGFIREYAKKLT